MKKFLLLYLLSFLVLVVRTEAQQVFVGEYNLYPDHVISHDTTDTSAVFVMDLANQFDSITLNGVYIVLSGDLEKYASNFTLTDKFSAPYYAQNKNDTVYFSTNYNVRGAWKLYYLIVTYQVPNSQNLVDQFISFNVKVFTKSVATMDTFTSKWGTLQTVYWQKDTASSSILISKSNNVNVDVFPNPTTGKCTLTVPFTQQRTEVAIYNILGKEVYKAIINNEMIGMDLSSQPKGIYTIEARNERGIFNKKIVVE